jgi:hypothetical protein
MLASHAALEPLTGSPEMFVFHTLSAGNIGQLAAPGTLVPVAGAGAGALVTCAAPMLIVTGALCDVACAASGEGDGRAGPAADGLAAQPATPARTIAATARRRVVIDAKCPVRMLTVASWHAAQPA